MRRADALRGVSCRRRRARGRVPVLYYLAGLTCTEETFTIKAGAQRVAAELGPDAGRAATPARAAPRVPRRRRELGLRPRRRLLRRRDRRRRGRAHYRMDSYVTRELPALVDGELPGAARARSGIFGHSMGGHGALTSARCATRTLYRSRLGVRADLRRRSQVPVGREGVHAATSAPTARAWRDYDASRARRSRARVRGALLVDQGTADKFLDRAAASPSCFEAACARSRPAARRCAATPATTTATTSSRRFIDDHLAWHASALNS